MTRHTVASTEWVITASAAAALEAGLRAEVVLVDRTPIDAVAYLLAALEQRGEEATWDERCRLTTMALLASETYLVHLATVLDSAIPLHEQDGKDSDYFNPGFRAAINGHVHTLLEGHGIEFTTVGAGQHAEAVETACTAIAKALDVAS